MNLDNKVNDKKICSPNLWNVETTIFIIIWYNNAHIWLEYLSFHCIYVICLSERAYLSCFFIIIIDIFL